ncbi:amino acid ABC transporter permease [Terrihabitans soli]|uniref:Amino acid ABC transporter permease n=1 Tax=Terrihabitans soli TaxID=708113 RepID=A0A6S6QS51_9HYPH|nr:amino acid ABC transporter permease [Terrihabitans soli]BCJ91899.1 amino acid ABC transporter permease [Terrihabitans soli]
MAKDDSTRTPAPKTAFYNDPVIRGRIYQALVLLAVIAAILSIAHNTAVNLERQNKTTGFDFFWATAGFDIFFTLIPYSRASYYWEAFLVGMLNTLLVAVLGIFFATLIGFVAGIARLSGNFIISSIATFYIETIRNIPALLQLFFWYFAVLKAMPPVRESFIFFDSIAINNRGLNVPRPIFDGHFHYVVIAFLLALAFVFVLRKWSIRHLEKTGQRFPFASTALAILVFIPGIVWMLSGTQVTFDIPQLGGFNFRGGVNLPPEFVAIVVGISIYTGSFIAETVRAGILAVNWGQTEAAQSLGLKSSDRLRLVIIPQAMRVIIPPMTNQYLNLVKNSSLAAAIGYPELVSVFMGTTLNQTGRAVEVVFITMLVYFTLSFSVSSLMNWYNRRVALVER